MAELHSTPDGQKSLFEMTKRCNRCKQEKPLSEFGVIKGGWAKFKKKPPQLKKGYRQRLPMKDYKIGRRDGTRSWCKECAREHGRMIDSTPEGKQKKFAEKLRMRFGITVEDYERMHQEQKGLCAICGNPETAKHRHSKEICRLSVDHDHTTKIVRALLCGNCNRAVGLLKESPTTARNLAAYLEAHKQCNVQNAMAAVGEQD